MGDNFITTTIRLGTTDDLPFIITSWTQAMYDVYPNKFQMDFNKKFHKHCESLCAKSTILVAHLKDNPEHIISYLVYTSYAGSMVVHYAYTKFDNNPLLNTRRQGNLTNLLQFANPDNKPIIFTHPPKKETVMKHFASKYIYDPSIMGSL